MYNCPHPTVPLRCALSIASSDSGAGAGTQADLKTFAAHQVYGLSVISAVTAQNTCGVTGVECVSPELITAQLEAVFSDMSINAIKIGLIGNVPNTLSLYDFLKKHPEIKAPIILDPVMVSASGHSFLPRESVDALKNIMSLGTLLTPNIPEAEALSGIKIENDDDAVKASEILLKLGARAVLIKGGHRSDSQADDLLNDQGQISWFKGPKINSKNNHGTGCTLSSAIAANMAKGLKLEEAIGEGKIYVTEAMRQGINLGKGPGPLNHFYKYYSFGM